MISKKKSTRTVAPSKSKPAIKQSRSATATLPAPEPMSPPETTSAARQSVVPGRIWFLTLLAGVLILLVGAEVFYVLKDKVSHQGKLVSVQYFGNRGSSPDEFGKFWGASRIRVDETQKRLSMIDGMFGKVLYWNVQSGAHLTDLDKNGIHKINPKGDSAVKNFSPTNGDMDGNGNLYVIDRINAMVTIFSPDMKVKGAWSSTPSDRIAVTKSGQVYIMDYRTLEIAEYSADGKELRHFGKNTFVNPGRMAADESGNLYVLDLGRKQVIIFSPAGKILKTFSPAIKPFVDQDIDVRDGKIYLSAYDITHLFVYTTQGKLVWNIQLPYAGTIAVDSDGLVYLAGAGGIGIFRIQNQFDSKLKK